MWFVQACGGFFSTQCPDPSVAVISGGAFGLAYAAAIVARGVRAVIFHTVRPLPRLLSAISKRETHFLARL